MRTFRILAAGWVAGAALVAVMGGAFSTPARELVEPVRSRHALMPEELRPRYVIPVAGIAAESLRDSFGQPRSGGRKHAAIDILAPRGTPVVAAVDGTIRKLFTSSAGGLTIYQFDPAREHVYYYAHLDRYVPTLVEGQVVRQGTVIGYVGTTGNAPPGTPHLHFAIERLPPTKEWWRGQPVDPYPLLSRGGISVTR